MRMILSLSLSVMVLPCFVAGCPADSAVRPDLGGTDGDQLPPSADLTGEGGPRLDAGPPGDLPSTPLTDLAPTAPDAGRVCATSWTTGWVTLPMPSQSGSFQVSFTATPSHGTMDGVTGLSHGIPTTFDDLPVIVRFNPGGAIDARDGDSYVEPAPPIGYSAGVSYRFRLVVDLPGKRYDAFVTPAGGAERAIGSQLAFRTAAQNVTPLDSVGLRTNPATSAVASHQVCDVQVTPAGNN